MKFEYKTLIFKPEGFWGGKVDKDKFDDDINRLGADGWELVSTFPTAESYGKTINVVLIFKRAVKM